MLVIWVAAAILLLVALILHGCLDVVQAKLQARARRRLQAKRELLRKSGWR